MRYKKICALTVTAAMLATSAIGFAEYETDNVPELKETAEVSESSDRTEIAEIPETTETPEASEAPEATEQPEASETPAVDENEAEDDVLIEKPVMTEIDENALMTAEVGDKVKVGEYDISDSIERYQKFDYSDPQYITDELLFGVWDSDNQCWIPQENALVIKSKLKYPQTNDEPLIDYSYDPGLAKVEEAVKTCNGNYTKPKALLLQYYRNKFKNMNKEVTVNGSKVQTARANALAYNFTIKSFNAINVFDVTNQEKYYEFDVTDQISTIISGTGTKKFCFALAAIELDGAKAMFGSRESENKPYVTLNLTDGTTQTFYPEADATTKGGGNKGKSFPSEKLLYAQERKNVNVENDGNSQRAFIRFDFSSIPQGTRVVSATFGVCGVTDRTDAPKRVFLGSTTNVTWAENGLTWSNSNFTNELSFDTLPGLIPGLYPDNYCALGTSSEVLAARYLYDKNEIYAYHGIRYLLQYHKNIDTRAFLYNDFLAKGVNGISIASSIYSFIDSEYMTPQNFAIALKSVYCNTEWILEGWNSNSAAINSNHATYYNRGFASLITLFPEFKKANAPLEDDPSYKGLYYGGRGGWIPCLQRRVMYKAKEVSFADGAGKEVAGGYNMEAYANTVAVLQFATEANMPEILPDDYYDKMAVAALYFMHGMAPGYRDWGVGNSYGYGSQFINRPVIKQIIDGLDMLLKKETDQTSEVYKERKNKYDQLMYAYTAGKSGTMPEFESILYPMARKVVMRDGWNSDAVGATMGIANGGIHSHFDDLSIVVAAYGRYLLADMGKVDYVQNEPYKCWLNSTRAHNTIEINDISQRSGFWSNWEVAKGPSGENLVFPFRGDHGLILANNVSADAVAEPENAEYKAILDNKDYTQGNLKKLYDFDDKLAVSANSSIKTRHFQGRFLESEMNSTFDYVKGETYNNIGVVYKDDGNVLGGGSKEYTARDNSHSRSMLFIKSASVPSFYIVTDNVAPVNGNTEENKYSQAWHFTNDADITLDPSTKTVKTHFDDVNLAVVPIIGKEIETEASLQDGWYHTSANVPAKYVTYVKKASQPTTFNTVLLPMDSGKDYDMQTELISLDGLGEADASAFSFNLLDTKTKNNVTGTYYNLHSTDKQTSRKVGDYTTDARIMYADNDGTYDTTAIVADGTELLDKNGNYLLKSDENVSHLGIEWRGTGVYLSASQTNPDSDEYVDLSKLTIRNQRNSSQVYLNGEQISFNQKDGYIYFGDEPIIDGGDTPVPPTPTVKPDNSKPSSGHGGGGSSGGGGGGGYTPSNTAKPSETEKPSDNGSETENEDLKRISAAFAAELKDHWGKKEIASLVRGGVVNGVSDDSLGLSQTVSRAEFSALLVRAFGIEQSDYANEFPDIDSSAWYAKIMAAVYHAGILSGDENGNANPNDGITREQAAKLSVLTLEKEKNITAKDAKPLEFTDKDKISSWAEEYIQSAQELGLMNGLDDGSFAPLTEIPRDQAMVLIYRLINSGK